MGVSDEAGKAVVATVESMKATPLAIALLIVNIGFLVLFAWIFHEVAAGALSRNATQDTLILNMVETLKHCKVEGNLSNSLDALMLNVPAEAEVKND